MRTRISPALVVACLALAVALGGVSYAAVSLPKNSVGTKQLKRNAVNGVKVQNKSLGRLDINQASLGFGKSVSIAAADMYGTDASACVAKDPSDGYLTKQLQLPQGARITKVTAYVLDNTAGNVTANLTRYAHSFTGASDLRTGSNSGDSPNLQQIVLTGSPITVVDNANYTYVLNLAVPSSGQGTCGARVDYTLP